MYTKLKGESVIIHLLESIEDKILPFLIRLDASTTSTIAVIGSLTPFRLPCLVPSWVLRSKFERKIAQIVC